MVGGRIGAGAGRAAAALRVPGAAGRADEVPVACMRPGWNISLFHYRNQGADYGRILVGLQVPPADDKAFQEFLRDAGLSLRGRDRQPGLPAVPASLNAAAQRARHGQARPVLAAASRRRHAGRRRAGSCSVAGRRHRACAQHGGRRRPTAAREPSRHRWPDPEGPWPACRHRDQGGARADRPSATTPTQRRSGSRGLGAAAADSRAAGSAPSSSRPPPDRVAAGVADRRRRRRRLGRRR